MANMIELHPVNFTDRSKGIDIEYINMTSTQYIDPECVEACEELKDKLIWVLHMVSGRSIGIGCEEFLKYKKVLLG